jgi:hypothetical protein
MGMNPAMFGMDPNNINLNSANPGNMSNFPMSSDNAANLHFLPGMFPMMNAPQSNMGGSPQQNN